MNIDYIIQQTRDIVKEADLYSPYSANKAVNALVGIIEDLIFEIDHRSIIIDTHTMS